MSHSWIGAPAQFNGTNPNTGGDSGMLLLLYEMELVLFFFFRSSLGEMELPLLFALARHCF
jgi:hypothetical protein